MTDNMTAWNAMKRPPHTALKQIQAGRLKGMSDINPQWRYQAMTEQYGPVGIGWKFTIDRQWAQEAADGQVFAFSNVSVYIKDGDSWSCAIPGTGGSMLIAKEKNGMHSSDEAFKMATTDALSVAMKMLGVGADIYMGRWNGEQYAEEPEAISEQQAADLEALITEVGANHKAFLKFFKIAKTSEMLVGDFDRAIKMLEDKRKVAK